MINETLKKIKILTKSGIIILILYVLKPYEYHSYHKIHTKTNFI
jgi:hypothetical protein